MLDDAPSQASAETRTFLSQLALREPAEAIKSSWLRVREAAQSIARSKNLAWSTTQDLVVTLEEAGVIDSEAVRLILDLRALRYDMAGRPGEVVKVATANGYVAAAGKAADILATLASQL